MDGLILQTPAMALELANILLAETYPPEEVELVMPLHAEDKGDLWFVTGNGDNWKNQPQSEAHNQLYKQEFYMHVVKRTSEVLDFGMSAQIAYSPEVKERLRAEFDDYRDEFAEISKDKFGRDGLGLHIQQLIHGGIINSADAAKRFGALIFANHFPTQDIQSRNLGGELVDHIWHVVGKTDTHRAELAFRRSNAEVVSLDLRPV